MIELKARYDRDDGDVASARRESIGTIGGIGPDPYAPYALCADQRIRVDAPFSDRLLARQHVATGTRAREL
jgi:hypothetical protein